jgi:histidinol dehydrogenase
MRILTWKDLDQSSKDRALSRSHAVTGNDVKNIVSEIIAKVRAEGDVALKYYAQVFDKVTLDSIALEPKEFEAAKEIDEEAKRAIEHAHKNIKRFHELQIPKAISVTADGIEARKEYRPIDSVGLYIPGGSAPLISTFLMLAIPALIAGCKKIIVITPPNKENKIHPAILYAAELCNVKEIYKSGGAQAVAALAYGTNSIPKVMKIFGPGNKYVTEAKQQVSLDPMGAALDMPAGPSEVLVIADAEANPTLVASDMLAQAEHDADSMAVLVTTSQKLANEVQIEISAQTKLLKRQSIIAKSLPNCVTIIVGNIDEAFAISNIYAPEHLILQIAQPKTYLEKISNAGSVFIGHWSAEALGDYASGPNHVLPTYGYAKTYSGLGVESFMKSITFQEVSKKGLLNLANTVEKIADLEGLDAHRNSVTLRREIIERE